MDICDEDANVVVRFAEEAADTAGAARESLGAESLQIDGDEERGGADEHLALRRASATQVELPSVSLVEPGPELQGNAHRTCRLVTKRQLAGEGHLANHGQQPAVGLVHARCHDPTVAAARDRKSTPLERDHPDGLVPVLADTQTDAPWDRQ